MHGKGLFIKNVRGYNFAKEELTTGVDKLMQELHARKLSCTADGENSDLCRFLKRLSLNAPEGKARHLKSYTLTEMRDFLRELKADWICVKAIDGINLTAQFDQNLVSTFAFSTPRLFALCDLRTSISKAVDFDEAGRLQAEAIVSFINKYPKVAGIVIVPAQKSEKIDFFHAPDSTTVTAAFLKSLPVETTVPLAYSPIHALICNEDSPSAAVAIHRRFLNDSHFTSFVPRCFWRASKSDDEKNRQERLKKFMFNGVIPWLYTNEYSTNPVVLIGQGELQKTKWSEVNRFAKLIRNHESTYSSVKGIGYWCLDELKHQDLMDFANLDIKAPPDSQEPFGIGKKKKPKYVMGEIEGCSTNWIPGVVPKDALPMLRMMLGFLEGVPECLPTY
ncbi:MAG: hypothetical protein ACR2IE_07450 [Candidatus Sumerlaeaceae bacterium]